MCCCLGYVFHMLGVHSSWLIYLFIFAILFELHVYFTLFVNLSHLSCFYIIVLYIIIEETIN